MDLTYHIDVDDVKRRSKGFCDLEAPYLWFNEFIEQDRQRRWHYVDENEIATFSSNPSKSLISFDIPRSEQFNQKEKFIEWLGGEKFIPFSLILTTQNHRPSLAALNESPSPLWFLKKAGKGIGGGYDVLPLHFTTYEQFVIDIQKSIAKLNIEPRYRRNIFILQRGIDKPMLTPKGQKFDLRIYMLLVGNKKKIFFYLCKLGDVRIASEVYDAHCADIRVQLTNTTQNKKYVKDLRQIKKRFAEDSETYSEVFPKIKKIARRIAEVYGPVILGSRRTELNPTVKPFFSMIGLDIVIDSTTGEPYLIELNRRPGVGRPDEEKQYGFSNMVFMRDVYQLGLCRFVDKPEERVDVSRTSFVFISVYRSED